ncbi:MAG: IS1595 family transposase [Planctomycetota bacterium]
MTHEMPAADSITLLDLQALFPDEDKARAYLEQIRWPKGPECPYCNKGYFEFKKGRIWSLTPNPDKGIRAGLKRCSACKRNFCVTVGTIMEKSHLPLRVWIMGFYMMMSSKTGISALSLQRHLGLGSYRSAWFLCHRIRHCLKQGRTLLTGTVEVDEMYWGGRPRNINGKVKYKPKTPVVGLIQRDGDLRVSIIKRKSKKVRSHEIRRVIKATVDPSAVLYTDEAAMYKPIARKYGGHETVNHSIQQYAKPGGITTNTIEGFFGLFRTGLVGVYHGVGRDYLKKYADEYVFRYNRRKMTDGERMVEALKLAPGCRLTLEQPKRRASGE